MGKNYAPAVWFPSPYFEERGAPIIAIVDHIAQGSRDGMRSVVLREQRSAHYFVCRNGDVDQYVDEAVRSWAAGIDFKKGYAAYKSNRTIPWIDRLWREGINPNALVINIEHEGYTGEPMPEEQYQASLALHRDICRRHDIPTTGEFIVGHYQLDAVTRAADPGPTFPWAQLLSDLNPVEFDHESIRGELDRLWEKAQVLKQVGGEIEGQVVAIKGKTGFLD